MMKSNISDKALDQQVAQLSKEMTPQRDLWVGIERAITSQVEVQPSKTQSKRHLHFAWAASFIAAVLLTWGSLSPQMPNKQTPLTLASMMEKNFEKNKAFILTSYGQEKNKTLSVDMQKQLAELASARAAINKALKADQNNSDLLNLLRWTQQQELDLLQQIYSPQWQTI
ncbi:hypothetical protein ACOYR1_16345 [Thalassotalea piscium]